MDKKALHSLSKTQLVDMVYELMQRVDTLTQEVQMLRAENEALRKENTQLRKENAELKEEVRSLKEEIRVLKIKKDSKTSSIPPSKDIKRTASLRKPTGRKSGGQDGHKGSTLRFSKTPNFIEQHMGSDVCPKCGKKHTNDDWVLKKRAQVIDISKPVFFVTEHQVLKCQCNCGHIQEGNFPENLKGNVQYGPYLRALVVYLSIRHYMPYNRIKEYIQCTYNLNISEGTIDNIIKEASTLLEGEHEEIRQLILESSVVGSDESSAKVKGENYWAWVYQTLVSTYIFVHKNRGKKAIEEHFPDGLPNTVLVSDAWASHLGTDAKGHQLCFPHMLRELEYFKKIYKCDWVNQCFNLFHEAIKLSEKFKEKRLEEDEKRDFLKRFDQLLEKPPSIPARLIPFVNRITKHRDKLFLFLDDPLVPFHNNDSEKAIRNFKVKLKVSGQFVSFEGANCYAVIRSVVDTFIKRGKNIIDLLREKFANPLNSSLSLGAE